MSAALPLHTDLPFYRRPPEVQLLHCVSPGPLPTPALSKEHQAGDDDNSGASIFADGLLASHSLSHSHRDLLLSLPVIFEDLDLPPPQSENVGGSPAKSNLPRYHLEATHTVLESSANGSVKVHLNNGVRASVMHLKEAETRPFLEDASGSWPSSNVNLAATLRQHYSAVAAFRRALNDETFAFKAEAGDVWVFDNRRVLHGRRSFSTYGKPLISTGGSGTVGAASSEFASSTTPLSDRQEVPPRHLEGAYMEWDDLDSLRRVLSSVA